ncbi:YlaI family protein [Oceanobacillus sp. FSL H7-0719]|uniref:YlaI family protein n=1 Tax=Oceanobacillus sp. FSL H7-0719 TaxID=2954507 RepID=UPI003251184B
MQVKCTICDKINDLNDSSFQAKRLRNRRTYMYLCEDCYKRIADKTNARHATGKFKLYEERKNEEEYI